MAQAQRSLQEVGFRIVEEYRHPQFEEMMDCLGVAEILIIFEANEHYRPIVQGLRFPLTRNAMIPFW